MSVIQKIREKYATIMILAVCVSLVAFLLMDAFVGPKSFFQHSNDVGSVDGQGMQYQDFSSQVQQAEEMQRAQNPNAPMDDQTREMIQNQVWDQFVSNIVLGEEYKQLGIGFPTEELTDLTVTTDADPQVQAIQAFQNPQTGQFDPNRVVEFLHQLSTEPDGSPDRLQWIQVEQYLKTSSLQRTFYSLIRQAIYIPTWLSKERQQEQNTYSSISYLSLPYSSVADSAVKVSDAEMQQYITDHKALFQQQASRSIEYVSFDAVPTPQDSAAILKGINDLKSQFDTVSAANMPAFITRNSESSFYDGYIPGSMIQLPNKDAVLALNPGQTYGPFYMNGMVAYAKMIDKKSLPDSVKVRHILISTQNLPDSLAKQRADSLEELVRKGANFDALVMEYSDDPGKQQNMGSYDITPTSSFVPEFKDFALSHKAGDIGVVKSQFGYHVMQIQSQKDFETAYKIAYLTKHMDPSQQTDNQTFAAANEFAGKNRTRSAFEASVQQQGLTRRVADNLSSSQYEIPQLGSARDLIRWAYGAKQGEVSNVYSIGNHYVVAVLTGIKDKGTAPLQAVRPQVEALVRQHKKAVLLAARLKGSTLSDIARNLNDSVQVAQHLSFTTPFIPNAGFEPVVTGAAFDKDFVNKLSGPVFGNSGVYVLTVDSLTRETAGASAAGLIQQQQQTMQNNILGQIFDMLKKQSDIKDNRLKYF